MCLSQLDLTWKVKDTIGFIICYAEGKWYLMPTKHPCTLNLRFSSNCINHANKVAFPLNSIPEIEISSDRCTFSMYLPFYWKVNKLAFTSLALSSWQFLSTAIPSTRLYSRQIQ